MKRKKIIIPLLIIFFLTGTLFVHAEKSKKSGKADFNKAAASIQKQLDDSLAELGSLREKMAGEKISLSRKLSKLEGELVKIRLDYQQTSRLLDSHTLDLSNLRNEIKSRREEATYLSNLLGEYIRNFESRLHIVEIQRYEKDMETATLAAENSSLSEEEVFKAQATLIDVSLNRLFDALAGSTFKGRAVDRSGLVKTGTFALVGPAALFRSGDGKNIGTAEQRLGSLEPAIIDFQIPEDSDSAAKLIQNSKGSFLLDPTLGNAHKIAATKETFLEHVQKGGPVMYPIFAIAGAALLMAIYKWIYLSFQHVPSRKQIETLLSAISQKDYNSAMTAVNSISGPVGRMLKAGVEHLKEPVELIEEVMYEIILATKLKLQSLLPFIAISAASAPLLGLLGTVTGIINTFKLITVFGSGDVKTLSGGISEALITTKFGLIVAIPSLLLHAFLSRKAKGVVSSMEKSAVAFANQVNRSASSDRGKE